MTVEPRRPWWASPTVLGGVLVAVGIVASALGAGGPCTARDVERPVRTSTP